MQQHDGGEEATRDLRSLILAGERYRPVMSEYVGLGVTEAQAVSYLTAHGDQGQKEPTAGLGLSSGASTARADRLARQGIAERYPRPTDRRRTLVQLTSRGQMVVQVSRERLLAAFQDFPARDHEALGATSRSLAGRLSERSAEGAQEAEARAGARLRERNLPPGIALGPGRQPHRAAGQHILVPAADPTAPADAPCSACSLGVKL